MKNKIFNSIILVGTVVFLLCYMFLVDGFENIAQVFRNAKLWWLLAGVGCMLLYWLFEALILHSSLSCFPNTMGFYHTFKTTMIGQYFNCITPSATGGQPMQAYYMVRAGVSAGYASSSLLVRFVVYQVGLTLYCLAALLFRYQLFAQEIRGFRFLILFGFAVTAVVAAGLLLIGFNKKVARKGMRGIVKVLAKIRIVKKPDSLYETIDIEVERFHDGFRIIRKNKLRLFVMFVLTILQCSVFFFVPVTIALAFGVQPVQVFTMMAAACCVMMASSFVPLPGAAGGAELSFFLLFGMFFSAGQLSSAILMWRLFTFYLPIVCGFIFARNVFGKKLAVPAKNTPDEPEAE